MTTITIETDNSQFVKAIVALCKAMGITSVRTSQPVGRLRKDLAERLDAIENGTAKLHTFESIEELKQALSAKTGVQL